jgi:hypothetical protein
MFWVSTLISSIVNNFNCFLANFIGYSLSEYFRLADGVTDENLGLIFDNVTRKVKKDTFKPARLQAITYYHL